MCQTLSHYLVSRGNKVIYLTAEETDPTGVAPGIALVRLPNSVLFTRENVRRYVQLLSELKVDIVMNHEGSNERAKFFMNVGATKVKVISIHHNDPLARHRNSFQSHPFLPSGLVHWIKIGRSRKSMRKLIAGSDSVVLLSERFIIEVGKTLGIRSSKLTAIPNAIPDRHESVVRKKSQVLFVGRLEMRQKRMDLLLKIWSMVEPNSLGWDLVVVGEGPDRQRAEQMMSELKLLRVRFVGSSDPGVWYEESSILCMTSDYEGFGMVLVEAMQSGVVPIVFNNWPTIMDIIDHKEQGFVVPPNDLNEFAEKLTSLMRDADLRKNMSSKAREKAKHFDVASIGPKWEQLFEALQQEGCK